MNNAALNIRVQGVVWTRIFRSLGYIPKVIWLGHMMNIFRSCSPFSKVAVPFYNPTSNVWGSQLFSHSFQHFSLSLSFSNSPYGFEVTSHVALIQISLMTNDAQHLYLPLLATFVSSLEKCLLKSFAHFNQIIIIINIKISLSEKLFICIHPDSSNG